MKLRYLKFIIPLLTLMIIGSFFTVSAKPVISADEDVSFISYFINIPSLATLILLVTQMIKKRWKKIKDDVAQYMSFGVGLVLSLIGWLFQYGIFFGVEWYYILIYGFAASLIANGMFDWHLIKAILVFLKLRNGEVKKIK